MKKYFYSNESIEFSQHSNEYKEIKRLENLEQEKELNSYIYELCKNASTQLENPIYCGSLEECRKQADGIYKSEFSTAMRFIKIEFCVIGEEDPEDEEIKIIEIVEK